MVWGFGPRNLLPYYRDPTYEPLLYTVLVHIRGQSKEGGPEFRAPCFGSLSKPQEALHLGVPLEH